MTWTIRATDFEEVIGRNPENADFSNPQGNYYGLVSYLLAENENGTRFLGRHLGDGPAEDFAGYAEEVNKNLLSGWTPDATWNETAPCYGSAAW